MSLAAEVLVPHVPHVQPVTHLRSTLLQSSLAGLKERGHFEAWSQLVEPAYRSPILDAVAPTWLPIEVGVAYYQACDDLRLPLSELNALAEALGARVQNTFLASLTKVAHQAGVTPWTPVPHFGRVWPRLFMGGSPQISKVGPKDLQFEVKGLSLCRFSHVRQGFAGVVRAALLLFGARSAYVKVVRYQDSTHEMTMTAAWA